MPKRQSPETFLQRAEEEENRQNKGKLKIYLGAAPGVGKTYTMLKDALAERDKGLDVVVGVVESHGRSEIDKMLQNLEALPRKSITYRDKTFTEFDLDAALNRDPGLLLVDEMAHTNAPGTRHEKRWQDIKELLDRGIDVYTTLNVQHIESLNDDVAQIIQIPIKETVPDSMLEMADTIELVDLPPETLLKRLKEGKVYFPEQAQIAAENFFRKGNLIALRELALRITAELVSTQVLLYRQGKGITHIWPIKDKILVCVGPGPESLKLIRGAKRLAVSLQAEWLAVYIDTAKGQSANETRNKAIQNLRFAEQLGADQIHILTGFDIVKEILNFAKEQNITQIMIWKRIRTRWRDVFFRNLADEIVRNSGEIDVYIMTGEREPETPLKNTLPKKKNIPWKNYVFSILIEQPVI
jgi:two-component system sensor histidine kinase KdpD